MPNAAEGEDVEKARAEAHRYPAAELMAALIAEAQAKGLESSAAAIAIPLDVKE